MSKNQTDDDSSKDGVLAPSVDTNPRVHSFESVLGGYGGGRNELNSSGDFREHLYMDQYKGKRNLFDALGYVSDPDYEHYRARYERTDTAPALVDKLPKKAWSQPEVVDTGSEDGESEFEKAINSFLEGEYTEGDPIEAMERATRMERLGNFSLIFIGLNDAGASPDDNDLDDEESATSLLENEIDANSISNEDPEDVIQFLIPYDQARVDEDGIEWYDDDPTDSRFGKPKSYNVDLGENRPTAQIHWSRLIHVAGDVFDNEFKSPSILKKSLNRIDDIEKILGGSAEGFWRAAYTGLVISPPEIQGQQTEFSDDGQGLHGQIDRYINNLSREIFTAADIETIDVTVEDPTGHLESQYRSLSTGHDIPQSILMGNETGERATEEDRKMFHERAADFRYEYCEPVVLERIINRLIRYKVFPEPEGGKYGYRINWPAFDERSEQEEWNIAQTKSNAISTGTGGNPLLAISPEEYRENVLGWKPEWGSEAEESSTELKAVEPEDLEVDEDDDRVQDQFQRMNRQHEPADWVETPDGLGLIDEQITEGEIGGKEATENSPVYAVIMAEEATVNFYNTSELQLGSEPDGGPENPEEDMGEENRENIDETTPLTDLKLKDLLPILNRSNVAGDGHFKWPESWRQSDTPARIIALKAWANMGARHGGGRPGGCTSTMRGSITDPDRFCADLKDRIYGTEKWRGGWV